MDTLRKALWVRVYLIFVFLIAFLVAAVSDRYQGVEKCTNEHESEIFFWPLRYASLISAGDVVHTSSSILLLCGVPRRCTVKIFDTASLLVLLLRLDDV